MRLSRVYRVMLCCGSIFLLAYIFTFLAVVLMGMAMSGAECQTPEDEILI